jgi:hypothetical protein
MSLSHEAEGAGSIEGPREWQGDFQTLNLESVLNPKPYTLNPTP